MKAKSLLIALIMLAGLITTQNGHAGTPADTATLIVQDSLNARSLFISEVMMNYRSGTTWGYAEFYNSGDTELDLGRYVIFSSNSWYNWWNLDDYDEIGKRHLRGSLKPGETYLVIQRYSNSNTDPYQNKIYPNGYTNFEASRVAGLEAVFWSAGSDEETYPRMQILDDHFGLFYSNVVKSFQDTVFPDSVFIDRFGVAWEDRRDNPGVDFSIAGATGNTPTMEKVFVRKWAVEKGNTIDGAPVNTYPIEQWNLSRGTDISDSEWIPLPKSMSGGYDKIFTTVGYHGPQPDFSLSSSIATIDMAGKMITMPKGISRDSVFRIFETGLNHGWELKLGADTAQFFMQNDDSLFFYTVGDDLNTYKFGVTTTGENAKIAQVAPLVYQNENGVYVRNYDISDGESPMDTIGTLPYDLPIDTFFKYMVKEEGATWEILPAGDKKSPEIKNGDILKVTSADKSVTKEYYLGVMGFFPSHTAAIQTVYFPGLDLWENPATFMLTDTMLNFNSGTYFYAIDLPPGTSVSPAFVASPTDHRANVVINRAKNVNGTEEERTASIIVTAEDDTTSLEYKIMFNVERETPPVQGDLFFTDVATSWGGYNQGSNLFFYNPSDLVVDLSDYVFVCFDMNKGWDGFISSFNNDSNWKNNNSSILRFGSIVEPAENGTPVFKSDLIQRKVILEPKERYGMTHLGGYPLVDAHKNAAMNELTDKTVHLVWSGYKSLTQSNWPVQGYNNYFAPTHYKGELDPYKTGALPLDGLRFRFDQKWDKTRFGLARILNDSIKDGLKHVAADFDNDYEWVDLFGGRDYDMLNGKLYDNDTILAIPGAGDKMGLYRKPSVYKGNPEQGGAFGTGNDETLETVNPSEWVIYGWNMEIGKNDNNSPTGFKAIRDQRVGTHLMITYAHIPYLTSSKYLLEEGLEGPQQVFGVDASTSVDQFLSNVNIADTNMVIRFFGADGSELSGSDALVTGSKIWSKSANGNDSVNYVINIGALSTDCAITSEKYTISKDATTGTISGIEIGTTLEDLISDLTAPGFATVSVTNGEEWIIPMMKYNNDTIAIQNKTYTKTLASPKVFVEVIAQDKVSKCVYSLEFKDDVDPFILSDVYVIDQDKKVIDFAGRTSPDKFIANLVPSTGASVKIVNKYDQDRVDGMMQYSDRVIVTKGDVSVQYWVKYTVNDEIIGVNTEKVELPSYNIYPNPTSDFVTLNGISGERIKVCDLAGKTIMLKSLNSNQITLDLRSLTRGIYIITTQNESFKVIKE